MSGSRFPWLPVLAMAAATVWAAAGSGAAPSRDRAAKWGDPMLLAQVGPPGGADVGGEVEEDEELDPSDTLGVEQGVPLNPDTTQVTPPLSVAGDAPADTFRAPPFDTTSQAAPFDTLHPPTTFVPVAVDSLRPAAADSARPDTLAPLGPRPSPSPSPAPQPKKPRTGILGIHPIAILLGLAVLHYFVTKTAGD